MSNILQTIKELLGGCECDCYEVVDYEDDIVEIRNPYLSYCVIKYGTGRMKYLKKHIEIILESGNPECVYSLLETVPSSVNVQECFDVIAESGDAEYNYKTVEMFGYKIGKEECAFDYSKNVQAIINSGDAKYNYMLANLVQKHIVYVDSLTDIEKQYYSISENDEKVIFDMCKNNVLESGDAEYNYLFAKDIKGADINAHAKVVTESRSGKYNYLFGCNVLGADKKKHYDIVLESGDLEYIYKVAFNLSNISDSKRVQDIMKGTFLDINVDDYLNYIIESGDAEYNYLSAFNIKNSDRKKHLDAVVRSFDPKFNYLSALAIDLYNKVGHETSVSSDLEYNNLLRKRLLMKLEKKGEDVCDFGDKMRHGIAVLISEDLEYNYLFARDIEGADVKSHEKVILAADDADYSRMFIKIPGADYEAHYGIILSSEGKKVSEIVGVSAPKRKRLGRKIDLIKEEKRKGSLI